VVKQSWSTFGNFYVDVPRFKSVSCCLCHLFNSPAGDVQCSNRRNKNVTVRINGPAYSVFWIETDLEDQTITWMNQSVWRCYYAGMRCATNR